jgi:hypothetical protein
MIKLFVTGPDKQRIEVAIVDEAMFEFQKRQIGDVVGAPRVYCKERGFWPKPPAHETWAQEFVNDAPVEHVMEAETGTLGVEGHGVGEAQPTEQGEET